MSNKKGFTLWFTGLSGSGKSTLSRMIEGELRQRGASVEVLDGDEVRENLSKGLGFSKDDRDTNVRRIGYVAKLLSRNGAAVITAAISPYAEVRDQCRSMSRSFVEVYAECSIDELTRRDVKGLYAKAISGEIKNFTGIDSAYEAPEAAEIILASAEFGEEMLAEQLINYLDDGGYL